MRKKLLFLTIICSIKIFPQTFQFNALFPDSHFVQTFTADAQYHRMEAASLLTKNRTIANIGAIVPVFNLTLLHLPIQLSIGGSSHIELEPDERANLVTTDFYVNYCLADILFNKNSSLRIGAGHSSHHFSDNWYEFTKTKKSLIYSKDYVQLFYIHLFSSYSLQFYFGTTYSYYFIINRETFHPWAPQIGFDWDVKKISEQASLYSAADIKLRHEVQFASTQNFQIGARWKNGKRFSARLAYQFRNGIDERGQYFSHRRRFHSIGLFFDL